MEQQPTVDDCLKENEIIAGERDYLLADQKAKEKEIAELKKKGDNMFANYLELENQLEYWKQRCEAKEKLLHRVIDAYIAGSKTWEAEGESIFAEAERLIGKSNEEVIADLNNTGA
jgi:hypothetical protein